jgi:hypothetical protein
LNPNFLLCICCSKIAYKNKSGVFSLTDEEKRQNSKKGGQKVYEEKKGIHALTLEQRKENGKKVYENNKGIFSLPLADMIEKSRESGLKLAKDKKGITASRREKHFFMGCIFLLFEYTSINALLYFKI